MALLITAKCRLNCASKGARYLPRQRTQEVTAEGTVQEGSVDECAVAGCLREVK